MRPHDVTAEFENAIAAYTGAPHAVATTSCTMAIFLALKAEESVFGSFEGHPVGVPRRTYASVPMQVIHAGRKIHWIDNDWQERGYYLLEGTPVVDSARLLTSGMYVPSTLTCLSFHWSKHLGIQQGGMILTDSAPIADWLRKARFDGRTPGVHPSEDTFMIGWHAYMSPEVAAEGLVRLQFLPKYNKPLPWDGYPDLSKQACFAPHVEMLGQ